MRRRSVEEAEQVAEQFTGPAVEQFVECLKGHNMLPSDGQCKKCGSPVKPGKEE